LRAGALGIAALNNKREARLAAMAASAAGGDGTPSSSLSRWAAAAGGKPLVFSLAPTMKPWTHANGPGYTAHHWVFGSYATRTHNTRLRYLFMVTLDLRTAVVLRTHPKNDDTTNALLLSTRQLEGLGEFPFRNSRGKVGTTFTFQVSSGMTDDGALSHAIEVSTCTNPHIMAALERFYGYRPPSPAAMGPERAATSQRVELLVARVPVALRDRLNRPGIYLQATGAAPLPFPPVHKTSRRPSGALAPWRALMRQLDVPAAAAVGGGAGGGGGAGAGGR
jgi:hypothetical protein